MKSFETTIWLETPAASPTEIEVKIDYETQQVDEHDPRKGFEIVETYCFVKIDRVWIEIVQTNHIKNQVDDRIDALHNCVMRTVN